MATLGTDRPKPETNHPKTETELALKETETSKADTKQYRGNRRGKEWLYLRRATNSDNAITQRTR